MFSKVWLRDTAERAIATFVQAAITVWLMAGPGDVFSVSTMEGVGVAGFMGFLAVLKASLATLVGDQDSASMDPKINTTDTGESVPDLVLWVFAILGFVAFLVLIF